MNNLTYRIRTVAVVLAMACVVGCLERRSDFAGATKSRLHLLEILGKAAIEKHKSLEGVSSIADFLDLMKAEAEGKTKEDEIDEWSRPFLIASYKSKQSAGILFVSLGVDANDASDDLRVWVFVPNIENGDIRVSRSWQKPQSEP
jgi:serine protease inhibitor